MADTTTLLVLILVGALLGWWSASRDDAPKTKAQPPPPAPLRPDEDPAPSIEAVQDLNAHIDETDKLLSEHETIYPRDDHDRPNLPSDFDLNAPDSDVVDFLRNIPDEPQLKPLKPQISATVHPDDDT